MIVILIAILLSIKYDIYIPTRSDFETFLWVSLVCLFLSYMLLRLIIGAEKADDVTSTVLEQLFRIWQRVSRNA